MVLQNLLSNGVTKRISNTLGVDEESAKGNSFKRDLQIDNFDSFGGDVTAGKFSEIARLQVEASTQLRWGYGSANAPENQGYLYVDLQNSTPAAIEGTLRLTVQSATGRQEEVVADFDTTKLDASKTDRTKQVPLPEQVGSPRVTQDSFLVVKLNPNANDTVSSSGSDVILPATEYDLS